VQYDQTDFSIPFHKSCFQLIYRRAGAVAANAAKHPGILNGALTSRGRA